MINKFKIVLCGLFAFLVICFLSIGIYILIIIVDEKQTKLNANIRITIIFAFFFIIMIVDSFFGIYILLSKRHINTKACWILALLYLPLIGVVLFLIFGTKSLSEKTMAAHRLEMIKYANYEKYSHTKKLLQQNPNSIFVYNYNTSLKPVYENNDIQIFKHNTELYSECINLIRSAKKFIHIQMYMLHDGFFLRTILAELIRKSREGIKVRFLYDWYGSYRLFNKKQIKELRKNGIDVGIFNPKGINMFKGLTNFRSHKKAIIVDNHTAIYGGSNFGDEYLGLNPNSCYWRDVNMILKGEIVNTINTNFCHDWITYTSYSLKEEKRKELYKTMKNILKPKLCSENKINMQMVFSSPLIVERNISDVLNVLISNAKKSIKIITPYFLPTDDLKQSIKTALKGNISVELLLPGKNDNKDYILTMNRYNYEELLELGCKIYEYHGFIHAKYVIVDNRYVFTGSNNFDFRSLMINFENCLLIDNVHVAKQFNEIYENDKSNSHLFTMNEIIKITHSFSHKWRILMLTLYKPIL